MSKYAIWHIISISKYNINGRRYDIYTYIMRNMKNIYIKDIIKILRERYIETYKIAELAEYLECKSTLKANDAIIEKFKEEIKKLIPKLCDATDDMNYEDILTRSSLMVTDYSGVQFDFAYMRKVLVYYHPDELPPHYEAGGLKYDTMGFGPICKNNKEIVDTLCKYIDNNCVTEEIYKKRADDFFAFDDHNNCERIYNEIKKYMDNKQLD